MYVKRAIFDYGLILWEDAIIAMLSCLLVMAKGR
jgi:hypothetical protein